MSKLSHIDKNEKAGMVDISDKEDTIRSAVVSAVVQLNGNTFKKIQDNSIAKGDVLTVAKIAGIQAAKQTSSLIPLCHPIPLSNVNIRFTLHKESNTIEIVSEVKSKSNTGVEMEAFTACSIAAVTIYDMVKAIQRDVVITDLKLISKQGGKSGEFKRSDI